MRSVQGLSVSECEGKLVVVVAVSLKERNFDI